MEDAGESDRSISSILCFIPAAELGVLELFNMGAGEDVIIFEGVCSPVAGPREALERETMGNNTVDQI